MLFNGHFLKSAALRLKAQCVCVVGGGQGGVNILVINPALSRRLRDHVSKCIAGGRLSGRSPGGRRRGRGGRGSAGSPAKVCKPREFQNPLRGTIISHGTPDDWLIMGRQHSLPRQDKNAIKRSFILLLGVHYFSIPDASDKNSDQRAGGLSEEDPDKPQTHNQFFHVLFLFFVYLFIYLFLAELCFTMTPLRDKTAGLARGFSFFFF